MTPDQKEKRRLAKRASYLRNREHVLATTSKYHQEHPEVHNKANAKYRAKNLLKIREYNRQKAAENRKANPEHYKKIALAAYYRNREKFAAKNRERSKRWYEANKERASRASKRHRKEHPESRKASHLLRRARKRATVVDAAGIAQWMREIYALPFVRCHWCGTKVHGKDVHFDHVIALSKGGTHTIGNLCASCPDCNLRKHARYISDWICQGQTFLTL